MKLIKSLSIILWLLAGNLFAQNNKSWAFVQFNGDRTMGISMKYLTLGNPADAANQLTSTFIFPEFDFVKMNFEKGAWNWSYRNKLPGDFIGSGLQLVFTGEMPYYKYRPYSTWIHNFIGWWNVTKNVLLTDELALTVGGHIGDYYLDYSWDKDTYYNPHGFHVAIGPSMMIDYLIKGSAVLHFETSVAYAQYLADGDGFGSYPAPILVNSMLELRSNSKLFAGIEYITFLNRGTDPFRGQRFEAKLGFRFKK
ncbi:hypothetical protein [Mongoliitalea lutea]|uniref:MetA-pathway of phenol degradation n=1 Tax=Mongoliitalea lutea TaxID=849756 RepID=A0A8J3D0V2_9BACT|nr:hypothetical protein [Mongoliitalea lutea]GHB44815.1 hypothetical protein GCM10008106_27370 [Mongoliitalea lutea]